MYIEFKIFAKNKNTIEIYKKKMVKRSKAKSRKDREQDKKINRLMKMVDTSKKQYDTYYQFRTIPQPEGALGSTLGVSAVSLLEGCQLAQVDGAGAIQFGASKKDRTDGRIVLDNLNLQIQLKPSNAQGSQTTQQVCIAVIRSKDYRPYPYGLVANLVPTGDPTTGTAGHCDPLLLAITNSNPTVGAGLTSITASDTGYPTIVGNSAAGPRFGPTQFLTPLWATDSPFHYEVLYFKRHKLSNFTELGSRFGTVGVKYININLKNKLKGQKVQFSQRSNVTSAAAEVDENNVFLCMWSDQGASPPSADVMSRVKFYD